MTILLRLARVDEVEALTSLAMRSKKSNGYDEKFMRACQAELSISAVDLANGEYWVAEAGELCGCASLVVEVENRCATIERFFIEPKWQRCGVGRLLWQKLQERAVEHGVVEIQLDADPHAVAFYQAVGFAITGETPSGSIPGRVLPRMSLYFDRQGKS